MESTIEARGLLAGRIAVVTGAASGIGRAIALLFAREGARVLMVDRDGVRLARMAGAVRDGTVETFTADVTDATACARVVEVAADRLGGPTILCNNAGIIRRATVLETSEDEWDRVMDVNVKSIFLLSRAMLPGMIEGGGGSIVNTASGWGLVGGQRAAAYCASKGAVVQLTRAMALDHGRDNVRVNCICPGDTDTPMLRREAAEIGKTNAAFLQDAADRPLGRIGRPEDVANAALYLASDLSSFVTGTALVVDGGGIAG